MTIRVYSHVGRVSSSEKKTLAIVTAHKRILGQGNIFTGVCPRGGGRWLPSMHHRSHDQRGLHPGGRGLPTGRVGQNPPPASRTRTSDGTRPTGMLPCCC